jgi:integrase
MQNGQLIGRGKSWLLRYWCDEIKEGKRTRKRVCKKIAPFDDQHRTERSVRPLINEVLSSQNTGRLAEGSNTIQSFVEAKYLPCVREKKRPSTVKGYEDIYRLHVGPNVGGMRLADFGAADAQRLLDTLVKKELTTRTLLHIKSFMSGVISCAIRTEEIKGPHPLLGRGLIVIEGGKESADTYAYSLDEIIKMIEVLENDTRRTIVTVAGFTGLSLSEMRGLRWENIDGDVLHVERTYWRRSEGTTKTRARKAAVPLLPEVVDALEAHHKRNPGTTFVFEGPFFKPLDIATMGSKGIKRTLAANGITWHGFHSFRRGLATNLNELGVADKHIQAILRHSAVAVTQGYYIKTRPESTRAAMNRLAQALKSGRGKLAKKKASRVQSIDAAQFMPTVAESNR